MDGIDDKTQELRQEIGLGEYRCCLVQTAMSQQDRENLSLYTILAEALDQVLQKNICV